MIYLSVIMLTMIRTQIQLTEDQARRLRVVATERGVSVAAVIREALDRHLTTANRPSIRDKAIAAIGGFRSGRHDVAEAHDEHLADVFSE
jgi:plasmid stability protein